MPQAQGLLAGTHGLQGHVTRRLRVIGSGGQAADGGLARRHHRARVLQVLLAEERVSLHVQREVAVITWRRDGGERASGRLVL